MKNRHVKFGMLGLACMALLGAQAWAVLYTWTGASGIDKFWCTNGNWDLSWCPNDAFDDALININDTIDLETAYVRDLTIDGKEVTLQGVTEILTCQRVFIKNNAKLTLNGGRLKTGPFNPGDE